MAWERGLSARDAEHPAVGRVLDEIEVAILLPAPTLVDGHQFAIHIALLVLPYQRHGLRSGPHQPQRMPIRYCKRFFELQHDLTLLVHSEVYGLVPPARHHP